jgi:hypothetical protein
VTWNPYLNYSFFCTSIVQTLIFKQREAKMAV